MSPAERSAEPLPASPLPVPEPQDPASSSLDDCWNRIGVFGDRSCTLLSASVHCRNCQVYSEAGRSLLERLPPADYLAEWTAVLAESQHGAQSSLLSADGAVVRSDQSLTLMIFRLADELFALPVGVLLEVSAPFVVHSIPHRSTAIFLGLVNIRGEIMLAASLRALLGLAAEQQRPAAAQGSQRMAVASTPEGRWVFPIDEIFGIHLFNRADVNPAPSQAQEGHCCSSGVLQWRNRPVALLDPERIFQRLHNEITPR